MAKSKRTKATSISQKTKQIVWERDNHCCIICGNPQANPNAHFTSRAHGGKGIEQNIVTLCMDCHRKFDNPSPRETEQSKEIGELVEEYLERHYPNFTDRVYKRGD